MAKRTWPWQIKWNWRNMFLKIPIFLGKGLSTPHIIGPLPCVTDYFCPWKMHRASREERQTDGGKKWREESGGANRQREKVSKTKKEEEERQIQSQRRSRSRKDSDRVKIPGIVWQTLGNEQGIALDRPLFNQRATSFRCWGTFGPHLPFLLWSQRAQH